MSNTPDYLDLSRHADLAGRNHYPAIRRLAVALLAGVLVAALFNVFGQRPITSRAEDARAVLSVYSPDRVRGGLLYTSRFNVTARRELKKAYLVLDPGWIEGMQVNSINPQPVSEASRNGRIVLDLGHIPAGHSVSYFIEFQVNPTNVGRRSQNVELDDGPQRLLTIHRSIIVFP